MTPFRKEKPFIFEGYDAELYKKKRNNWIRLTLAGTGLPFVLPVIFSFFNDTFNLLELFGHGEAILPLFSSNLLLAFDLFDMKANDDENLAWSFWRCILISIIQLGSYCAIRLSSSNTVQIKSVGFSIFMIVISWISCIFSIKSMFKHTISDKEG